MMPRQNRNPLIKKHFPRNLIARHQLSTATTITTKESSGQYAAKLKFRMLIKFNEHKHRQKIH